jgi:hypothetical protein
MCQVKSREKTTKNKPKNIFIYSGQQRKEMDYDEPHLMPNEKRGPSNGQNSQLVH